MQTERLLTFGPYRFNPHTGQVWRSKQEVKLTPKAVVLLRFLVDRAGQVVTKEELFQAVWPDTVVSDAALTSCIQELRQAFHDNARKPRYIATVHRRGFRFLPAVATRPVPGSKFHVQHLHSPIRIPQSAIAMVGRDSALSFLHERLAKAVNGQRQIVFVTGELGIGKTTLVEVFLHSLVSDQVQSPRFKVQSRKLRTPNPELPSTPRLWIGRGQCVEHYGVGEAYLPILEALGRLCREAEGSKVLALLRQQAPSWLVQMPAFLSPAELEELQRRTAGVTRERMLRELAEALEALTAERALILRVEDLHWSDYSTLDLLSVLARRQEVARLLVLGTYRPVEVLTREHPLKGIKQELQVHGQCEELALDFLTEEHVGEYLATRFSVGARHAVPLQRLARAIHRRTDGNALFMVNVINDLVAQGMVVQTNGKWEIQSEGKELTVGTPVNLRQLIEQQIARVSPDERKMLEAASVAGAEFSAAAVAASVETGVEAVEAQCDGLVRREQFLRPRGASEWPDGTIAARYGFVHALYQEVLYEQISTSRRVRLHRQIGEREEQGYGERAREVAAELAVHFERGRDYQRAVQYRQQAGENATQRNAYQEAISHFTTGLELLKTLSDTPTAQVAERQKFVDEALRCTLLLALGEAQRKAGDHLGAQETFLCVSDIARTLGATESFARAGLELAKLANEVGLPAAPAVRLLEEALQGLGTQDSLLTAKTLSGLALSLGVTDAQPQALVYAQQAVAMARRLADPELLAASLLGMIYAFQGPEHAQQRLAYTSEMLQLAKAANAKQLLLNAHFWRIYCLLELGDMPAMDAAIDAHTRLAEEEQQPFELSVTTWLRATRALMQGRFADSERLAQEALTIGQRLQTEHAAGIFGLQMFTLRREQGRLKELEPVVRYFVQQHTVAGAWRPGLALIYSELGRSSEARAEFDFLAQHDFTDLPRDALWMGSMTYLVDVCTFLGDKARAATLYQLLLPYAGRNVLIGNAAACYGALSRYLGALATTLERWDDAERHFEEALAMNTRMGAQPWLAHTQYQYATMLLARNQPGDRKKALALRKAALAMARALGMRALAERLTAA